MAKRARKAKEKPPVETALEFINSVKSGNDEYCLFARLTGGEVVYNNRIISAGHPIPLDFETTFHIQKLLHAVKSAGNNTKTVIDNNQIKIETGNKQYIVPVIGREFLAPVIPTEKMVDADTRFTDALVKAATVTREGDERVLCASVKINGYTVAGTDGNAFFEAIHHAPIGAELVVPTVFVQMLKRVGGDICGVGWNQNSITVHYSNGSWLGSQCYVEGYEADFTTVQKHFDGATWQSIPDYFKDYIDDAKKFCTEGFVDIDGRTVAVYQNNAKVFSVELPHALLNNAVRLNLNYLHQALQVSDKVADLGEHMIAFKGDGVRSVVMAVRRQVSAPVA